MYPSPQPVHPRFLHLQYRIMCSISNHCLCLIQALEFPEKLKHLGLACLTVSVWDRSKLPSMEIGVVKFKDAGFWKQFVAQPDLTVTEWYVLYTADHTHRASPKHQFLTLSRKYFQPTRRKSNLYVQQSYIHVSKSQL